MTSVKLLLKHFLIGAKELINITKSKKKKNNNTVAGSVGNSALLTPHSREQSGNSVTRAMK